MKKIDPYTVTCINCGCNRGSHNTLNKIIRCPDENGGYCYNSTFEAQITEEHIFIRIQTILNKRKKQLKYQ